MLRKSLLALATCVTLGAAALSPTAASAHWGGGWHGGGWYHGGPFVRVYAGGYGGCMVRTWVATPYGPALRWVNRCY